MNEKDLLKTIKLLKRLLFLIVVASLLGIGGEFLMAMKAGISNSADIQNLKEKQIIQQTDIDKKADVVMVKAVKDNIEREIDDKFNAIKGQLDIVIAMLPSVTYNYKPTTNNKK